MPKFTTKDLPIIMTMIAVSIVLLYNGYYYDRIWAPDPYFKPIFGEYSLPSVPLLLLVMSTLAKTTYRSKLATSWPSCFIPIRKALMTFSCGKTLTWCLLTTSAGESFQGNIYHHPFWYQTNAFSDAMFRTSVLVPEPSMLALIAAAAGASLFRRKRTQP